LPRAMKIKDDCPNQDPSHAGEMSIGLTVPDGVGPGDKLEYCAPDGQDLRLTIPEGVGAGSTMTLMQDPFTGEWSCIAELEETLSCMSTPRSACPDDVMPPYEVAHRLAPVIVRHPPVYVSGPPIYTVNQLPVRNLPYMPPPKSPVNIVLMPSYTPPPHPQLVLQSASYVAPAHPMQQQAGSYSPPPLAQVLMERHSFVPAANTVPAACSVPAAVNRPASGMHQLLSTPKNTPPVGGQPLMLPVCQPVCRASFLTPPRGLWHASRMPLFA